MTKRQTIIITTLSIIAFILALMTAGRYWFRIDMTKSKAHTISQVSRNIHREIPDPVNITYYLSDKLRTVTPVPAEIEDTLREYAAYSRGKIRLTVRDPVKAALADTVEELGLVPRQVQTVEQDQASLVTVYSGIVIEYLDKLEILPWVISTDTLEYDLTSRIRAMIMDAERWIGVIVGDSYRPWRENFGYLNMTLAEAGYRIRLIGPGDEIPENTPGLFVLGGAEELGDWDLYRIDRYIQQGGKVFFAVKGVFVDTIQGSGEARHLFDRGLLEMIASYGVTVRPELVLDKNALPLQYQSRTPYGGVQIRLIRYPLWIGVLQDNTNSAHPVSAGFAGLDLYWASPLELHLNPGIEVTPLLSSTSEAWLMREEFHTNPDVAYMMEMEAPQTRGDKILGAAMSGVFPSFFAGAPKPVREGSEEELPDMPESASPARIIVMGDVDFATNLINATQARHNLDFLLRVADWLINADDIINIRNRLPQTGRLDRITDPQRLAAAMRFSQILNVGLVPLFVIISGLFIASRRKHAMRAADKPPGDTQSSARTTDKESGNDI